MVEWWIEWPVRENKARVILSVGCVLFHRCFYIHNTSPTFVLIEVIWLLKENDMPVSPKKERKREEICTESVNYW
jgi:hypothetical protein